MDCRRQRRQGVDVSVSGYKPASMRVSAITETSRRGVVSPCNRIKERERGGVMSTYIDKAFIHAGYSRRHGRLQTSTNVYA